MYFLSIFLIYFIGKEFLELFNSIYAFNNTAAYIFLGITLAALTYFVIIPVVTILRMKTIQPPVYNENEIEALKIKRLKGYASNKLVKNSAVFSELKEADYEKVTALLKPEVDIIRKKYVKSVFYSTAISQNGFLDAFLFLTSAVNMVKEIFITYNGRVSNSDLLAIARKVYFASAIAGTEGVEYATSEIFSKFATDSLKSIPFLDKLSGSLADGFINAVLLTRISFITENYCTMLLIKKDSDLAPAHKIVVDTTKNIVGDLSSKITTNLSSLLREHTLKISDLIKSKMNPVKYLLEDEEEIEKKPVDKKSAGFFNQLFRK